MMQMQRLHEDHSDDFLCQLKELFRNQKRFKKQLALNQIEDCSILVPRKREEKLDRKELHKMMTSMATYAPQDLGQIIAAKAACEYPTSTAIMPQNSASSAAASLHGKFTTSSLTIVDRCEPVSVR